MSFTQGIFPNILKIAKVVPVFKSGNYLDCSNYRPISLLSALSKILEKLVHKRLYDFLDKNRSLYFRQFGFRPNYSTSFALLELIENIKKELDNGKIACGIFFRFEKSV